MYEINNKNQEKEERKKKKLIKLNFFLNHSHMLKTELNVELVKLK